MPPLHVILPTAFRPGFSIGGFTGIMYQARVTWLSRMNSVYSISLGFYYAPRSTVAAMPVRMLAANANSTSASLCLH